jgi:hypothetical protein
MNGSPLRAVFTLALHLEDRHGKIASVMPQLS